MPYIILAPFVHNRIKCSVSLKSNVKTITFWKFKLYIMAHDNFQETRSHDPISQASMKPSLPSLSGA